MSRLFLASTIAVALSISTVSLASDKTPQSNSNWLWSTAAAPTQDKAADAKKTPEAALPVAPPAPNKTEVMNFDNWSVTCLEYPAGTLKRSCSALLQVAGKDGRQIVLSLVVGYDQGKMLRLLGRVPTGVSVAPGVELRAGAAAAHKFNYETCEPNGCTVLVNLDAALAKELSAAPSLDLMLVASNGQNLKVSIPAKGFDNAYAMVTKAVP